MPYRHDQDLRFLAFCDNEDLEVLVTILRGPSDSPRLGEGLTSHDGYKKHYPNHKMYWQEIAEELQRYGGNSVLTAMRGWNGVLYAEILSDVCGELNIETAQDLSVPDKEARLLSAMLERSLERMTEEERATLLRELGVKSVNLAGPAVAAAIQGAIFAGGFVSYQTTVVVANAVARALVGQGLRFGANAALTRAIGVVAGPIGWTITGLWTALEIAGPSYRITVPACVHIAYMRAKTALSGGTG